MLYLLIQLNIFSSFVHFQAETVERKSTRAVTMANLEHPAAVILVKTAANVCQRDECVAVPSGRRQSRNNSKRIRVFARWAIRAKTVR